MIILKKKNDEWIDTKTQLRYTGLQNALDHVIPEYSSRNIIINKKEGTVTLGGGDITDSKIKPVSKNIICQDE